MSKQAFADKSGSYRSTELGIIPDDWKVRTLAEVTERISVGLATSVTKHYRDSGVPIIRNLNIKDGYFDGKDMLFLEESFAKANASKAAKALDVITVHTGANLGQTCVLPPAYDNCQTFTTLITTPRPKTLDSYFLSYQMGSFQGRQELARLEVGGGKGNLNTSHLKQYRLAVPPTISEQRAIAAALSDVDELIGALDKLIAKKRAIKLATMQQLLTRKTRLPGFSGDWRTQRIEELADVDPENLSSSTDPNYAFNYISLEQVDVGRLVGVSEEVFRTAPSRARRVLRHDDVLMSTVRPNLMSHLHFRSQVPNAVCSTGFAVLRARPALGDPGFLFAHLFGHVVNKQIEKTLAGSNYPAINSRDVRMIEVPCPPTTEEQSAIAGVLSDMDAEIAVLDQRRDKTKAIKQGMMQSLLTGRVRLVESEGTP